MNFEDKILFQRTLSNAMEIILDRVDRSEQYENIASYHGFEFLFFIKKYFHQYYIKHESDFDFMFDDFFAEFNNENLVESVSHDDDDVAVVDIYKGCEILRKLVESKRNYRYSYPEECRDVLRDELARQSKYKPNADGLIETILLLESRIVKMEYKLEREINEITRNYEKRKEEWYDEW